jgi:hypothetical protein
MSFSVLPCQDPNKFIKDRSESGYVPGDFNDDDDHDIGGSEMADEVETN